MFRWLLALLYLSVAASAASPVTFERAIFLTKTPMTFDAVKSTKALALHSTHVNYGFTSRTAWVRLHITNTADRPIMRMLDLDNPLLETAELFSNGGNLLQRRGMLHEHNGTLRPAFTLTLPPHTQQVYWLRIRNTTTALQFSMRLTAPEIFKKADTRTYALIVGFLGMLAAIWILSLLMYAYTQDSSLAFYALYLAALVFQQLTYLGFLPLHTPLWFTRIDNAIVVPKVGIMIIAAALYARAFLKTQQLPAIDRGYRLFIYVVLVEIILTGTPWFYFPEIVVLTGFGYILYTTVAGILIYRHGHKEARFFVAAWMMLLVGYLLMIVDALGLVSVMYHFPQMILGATAVEALLLMLAFVDRFHLYEQQKLTYEQRYTRLLSEQKAQIEAKVVARTDALNRAFQTKEILYKELHHRVKNNLQLILSIIRLQARRAQRHETTEQLQQLQGRIETIATTHELLYQQEGVDTIDMHAYLKMLSRSMLRALTPATFKFQCDCSECLPLREAVYVGLIINELFTNAVKHAAGETGAVFGIVLKHTNGAYRLEVTTPCQTRTHHNPDGLGLTIVQTLVVEQLGGTLEQKENDCAHTRIGFVI